jgi:hypothetical protein
VIVGRPDQVIGPPGWPEALGYEREEGWVLAPDQLRLHKNHSHVGYTNEEGNVNTK